MFFFNIAKLCFEKLKLFNFDLSLKCYVIEKITFYIIFYIDKETITDNYRQAR